MTWQVLEADCVEAMRDMDPDSIDAVVTDPPAGISFMGRGWDSDRSGGFVAWLASVMEEALRVTKPGGYALVWALPRTSHWTGSAIEAAGWEIRDRIAHHFGSGFPKSHNLGNGFGTALKPATEDWWLARKPLVGTVAQNVERFGTGAINVDACRIGSDVEEMRGRSGVADEGNRIYGEGVRNPTDDIWEPQAGGRWPANVALSHAEGCERVGERRVKGHAGYPNGPGGRSRADYASTDYGTYANDANTPSMGRADPDGLETVEAWSCVESCPVAELDRQSGELHSQDPITRMHGQKSPVMGATPFSTGKEAIAYGDTGGASRFFYVAKASRAERDSGLGIDRCTCETSSEWVNEDQPASTPPDSESQPPRATTAPTSEDGSEWSTTGSGSSTTARSPKGDSSITETDASRTTESRTSSSSIPSPTSGSTPPTTASGTDDGSGAAPSVASGRSRTPRTSTSRAKAGSATADADPATSKSSSNRNSEDARCASCGGVIGGALRNAHPT